MKNTKKNTTKKNNKKIFTKVLLSAIACMVVVFCVWPNSATTNHDTENSSNYSDNFSQAQEDMQAVDHALINAGDQYMDEMHNAIQPIAEAEQTYAMMPMYIHDVKSRIETASDDELPELKAKLAEYELLYTEAGLILEINDVECQLNSAQTEEQIAELETKLVELKNELATVQEKIK